LHQQVSSLMSQLYRTKRAVFDPSCDYMDTKLVLH
jgi:hypothetical protein